MLTSQEYVELDGYALHRLVRTGQLRPQEIAETAEAAREATAGTNTFVSRCTLQSLNDSADGVFAGIPIAVKDLGNATSGDNNFEGMRLLKDLQWRSATDEGLSARLRRENAIFVGRTNTSELGIVPWTEPTSTGPTRNPRAPGRSAGGSSGGSGAAVAGGAVPIAVGSDGGGSLRIPASACGVIALKPSRGTISAGPNVGEVWSGLGTFGFLTRTVRDTALALDAVAGPLPGDPYASPERLGSFQAALDGASVPLRVGIVTQAFRENIEVEEPCRVAVERTGALLADLGHVVEAARPVAFDSYAEMRRHLGRIMSVNIASRLALWSKRLDRVIREEDVEPVTWTTADHGKRHSGVAFLESINWAHRWTRELAAWWNEYDVLVTPTMPTLPPKLGAWEQTADPYAVISAAARLTHFTAPFNLSGQPGMSLPIHEHEGIPVGVQLVGRFGADAQLLQLASQLERMAVWTTAPTAPLMGVAR